MCLFCLVFTAIFMPNLPSDASAMSQFWRYDCCLRKHLLCNYIFRVAVSQLPKDSVHMQQKKPHPPKVGSISSWFFLFVQLFCVINVRSYSPPCTSSSDLPFSLKSPLPQSNHLFPSTSIQITLFPN